MIMFFLPEKMERQIPRSWRTALTWHFAMHEQTGFDIRLAIALRQSTEYCVDDALENV